MAKSSKSTPVVAELGRPETAQEQAERKAESSRKYRQRKTIQNLIAALGASVLLMAVIVLVVPRNDQEKLPDVDYVAAAQQAQPQVDEPLIVPDLGTSWVANEAEIRTGYDKVTEWYIGLLQIEDGHASNFVGVRQGIHANETWTYSKLGNRAPTGTAQVGGITWDEYNFTDLDREDVGNNRYALATTHGTTSYIVFGSSSVEAVQQVAASIAPQIPAA